MKGDVEGGKWKVQIMAISSFGECIAAAVTFIDTHLYSFCVFKFNEEEEEEEKKETFFEKDEAMTQHRPFSQRERCASEPRRERSQGGVESEWRSRKNRERAFWRDKKHDGLFISVAERSLARLCRSFSFPSSQLLLFSHLLLRLRRLRSDFSRRPLNPPLCSRHLLRTSSQSTCSLPEMAGVKAGVSIGSGSAKVVRWKLP